MNSAHSKLSLCLLTGVLAISSQFNFFSALASLNQSPIPKLEITYQYFPDQNRILNFRYIPQDQNLTVFEDKQVPCRNPVSCNLRSLSYLRKIDIKSKKNTLLFDAQALDTSTHPIAIYGDSSTISNDGNSVFMLTNSDNNEISGFWTLRTNGIDMSSSVIRQESAQYSLGSTIRFSEKGNTVLLTEADSVPFVETTGGRMHLRIPTENYWHGRFRNGAVSTSGTFSVFEQGGTLGHIYLFENSSGKLISQINGLAERTWGTNQIHFISDFQFVSVERRRIRVFEIINNRAREIISTVKPPSLFSDEDFHAASIGSDLKHLAYFTTRARLGVIELQNQRELVSPMKADLHGSKPTATFPVSVSVFDSNQFVIGSPNGVQFFRF